MIEPLEILKKYWNFNSFRGPQEAIIEAVLSKKNVLAMLPTGGGKSACFQVPALAKEGICIVISPLIALMNDQVASLQNKGIKALAITSGISFSELDSLLDNCIYGNYKFLYLSPERLQQELVQERIKQMNVNLIAIDEAHCISQWGNDFRPAYNNIVLLKNLKPDINIIALTASATKRVVSDICEQLELDAPVLFNQSLARQNIAYMVFQAEDKYHKIEQILTKNKEASIIYVRNRRATIEISRYLNQRGFKSVFYHGGMPASEKQKHMQAWMNDKVQVVVATNAFGMGIDKSNVRTVIHMQLPDSIENYFQEAGRAGRDNKKSYAITLVNNSDELQLKQQFIEVLPSIKDVQHIYRKLCSYFQISYGEGQETTYSFDFNDFCNTYKFNALIAYNVLRILDRESIISLTHQFEKKVLIQFIASNSVTLSYLHKNNNVQIIARTILRTYGGIFDQEIKVDPKLVAKKAAVTEKAVYAVLKTLENDQIIVLHTQTTDASVSFITPREDEITINPIAGRVNQQNNLKKEQIAAVISFIKNEDLCKSRQLLAYFGDITATDCGICSVCIKSQQKPTKATLNQIKDAILQLLASDFMDSRSIVVQLTYQEKDVLQMLSLLLDNGIIQLNNKNQYGLKTLN
jgi:ATP-dependent DNA helicase RecQ